MQIVEGLSHSCVKMNKMSSFFFCSLVTICKNCFVQHYLITYFYIKIFKNSKAQIVNKKI